MRTKASRLLVMLGLAAMAGLRAQVPPRDTAPAARSGTALISGVLVTDDAARRPVRRAIVTIGATGNDGRAVVTDDGGRFTFSDLPAGRYTLSAAKPGYINASFGAVRAGRPGTSIALSDGEQRTDVTLAIARGGVIAGVVLDMDGEPAQGERVTLLRYMLSPATGERMLQPGGGQGGTTDDRGRYRIFGLPAGDYLVMLNPRASSSAVVLRTTEASLQSIVNALSAPAAAPSIVPEPAVTYAPVFYPGTTSTSEAAAVTLATGEERTGIDMQVQLVATARVAGQVLWPDGRPAPDAQLSLTAGGPSLPGVTAPVSLMRPLADGTFVYPGLPPGPYTIAARLFGGSRPAEGVAAVNWATADVTLEGQDLTDVRLILQPGMSITGRVAFKSAAREAPPDPAGVRLMLAPMSVPGSIASPVPPVSPDASGRFSFAGLTPGLYRLAANPPGGSGAWTAESALTNGQDLLDAPFRIGPSQDVRDVVVTFTDRPTGLSGHMVDAAGRPAPEYFVVVFPADQAAWKAGSRRIAAQRPATDGLFSFRLPPGAYYVAALSDVEPGDLTDSQLLAVVSRSAVQVTLADGEQRRQDLRVAR